jgi:hypothetical protein
MYSKSGAIAPTTTAGSTSRPLDNRSSGRAATVWAIVNGMPE